MSNKGTELPPFTLVISLALWVLMIPFMLLVGLVSLLSSAAVTGVAKADTVLSKELPGFQPTKNKVGRAARDTFALIVGILAIVLALGVLVGASVWGS